MSDTKPEEAEVFPPPSPIPGVGRVQSPTAFDWSLFGNDDGSKLLVLHVHTILGTFSFPMGGAFAIQQLRPMMDAMFDAVAEPTPIVVKPQLVVPGYVKE